MAYNKTEKPDFPAKRKGGIRRRKKVCVFCGKDNLIDYKDVNKLKRFNKKKSLQNCKRQKYTQLKAFHAIFSIALP